MPYSVQSARGSFLCIPQPKQFAIRLLVSILLAVVGFALAARFHKTYFAQFLQEQWKAHPAIYCSATVGYLFCLCLYHKYKSSRAPPLPPSSDSLSAPPPGPASVGAAAARKERTGHHFHVRFTELTPGLCIGNEEEAHFLLTGDASYLGADAHRLREKFSSISVHLITIGKMSLDLKKSATPPFPHIVHTHFMSDGVDRPREDIAPYLNGVANCLRENAKHGVTTFVHCTEGNSISVTAVIYFLMRENLLTLEQAFNQVRAVRSFAMPNYGFLLVLGYYEVYKKLPAAAELGVFFERYETMEHAEQLSPPYNPSHLPLEFIKNPYMIIFKLRDPAASTEEALPPLSSSTAAAASDERSGALTTTVTTAAAVATAVASPPRAATAAPVVPVTRPPTGDRAGVPATTGAAGLTLSLLKSTGETAPAVERPPHLWPALDIAPFGFYEGPTTSSASATTGAAAAAVAAAPRVAAAASVLSGISTAPRHKIMPMHIPCAQIMPNIFIGNVFEARFMLSPENPDGLFESHIKYLEDTFGGREVNIVTIGRMHKSLAMSRENTKFQVRHTHFLPEIGDSEYGGELMLEEMNKIADHLKHNSDKNILTLAHCIEGVSRSPTIITYVLMRDRNLTLDGAIGLIQSVRPCAMPGIYFLVTLAFFQVRRRLPSRDEYIQYTEKVGTVPDFMHVEGHPLYAKYLALIHNPASLFS